MTLAIEPKDLLLAIPAFSGMMLGIYNFFNERAKRKIKLKVTPKSAAAFGTWIDGQRSIKTSNNTFSIKGQPDDLVIEIINFSAFPVSICEVGLRARGKKNRFAVPRPELLDGGSWPRRLEPRQQVIANIDWSNLLDKDGASRIYTAYAATECGSEILGSSRALKALVREMS